MLIFHNPPISVHCEIPYLNFTDNWTSKFALSRYNSVLSKADSIFVAEVDKSPSAIQVRNRKLIDDTEVILILWDGFKSGSVYNYMVEAKEKGKIQRNIWGDWIKLVNKIGENK